MNEAQSECYCNTQVCKQVPAPSDPTLSHGLSQKAAHACNCLHYIPSPRTLDTMALVDTSPHPFAKDTGHNGTSASLHLFANDATPLRQGHWTHNGTHGRSCKLLARMTRANASSHVSSSPFHPIPENYKSRYIYSPPHATWAAKLRSTRPPLTRWSG